nr:immunoglobulin light chain junction region [Macaca mulatta]
LQQHNSYPWTF